MGFRGFDDLNEESVGFNPQHMDMNMEIINDETSWDFPDLNLHGLQWTVTRMFMGFDGRLLGGI